MNRYRPTWAEIDLSAFAWNVRQLKQLVGSQVGLLAVLKADAYGHGAGSLANLALKNGASYLGVSSLEEGLELRRQGISTPILILGGIYPFENYPVVLKADLIPTVASLESARALKTGAERLGTQAKFHLKVDTGMGRLGLSIAGTKDVLEFLQYEKSLQMEGVYSHLSSADSDPEFTKEQLTRFLDLKKQVHHYGFKKVRFHLANSAGTLLYKDSHHDMIRPGLSLYGLSMVPVPKELTLKPVLSWRSKIVFLKKVSKGTPISYNRSYVTTKESVIATLPVGYADGVPRSVSNLACLLVQGKKCPLVGRVTMDHIMIDVTKLQAKIGETVTLIGEEFPQVLSVNDWAGWAGTISYEILCGISKRVPRVPL